MSSMATVICHPPEEPENDDIFDERNSFYHIKHFSACQMFPEYFTTHFQSNNLSNINLSQVC